MFIFNLPSSPAALKGASGGLWSVLNLQWMSRIRGSPLWLVCPAQHVSAHKYTHTQSATKTEADDHGIFNTGLCLATGIKTLNVTINRQKKSISKMTHWESLEHPQQTFWMGGGAAYRSLASANPPWRLGSCPALRPLQPFSIQGVVQPTKASSQIAFLGTGPVPATPWIHYLT